MTGALITREPAAAGDGYERHLCRILQVPVTCVEATLGS